MTYLITGGAGFIGSNLANFLLGEGKRVTIFDNLGRRGVYRNLEWLQQIHSGSNLTFVKGDVRDSQSIARAVAEAEVVFHLASQVAVTKSIENPREDFEINALGTLNVLEGARLGGHRPIIVYTSTNKVYGSMSDLAVDEESNHYVYRDCPEGINESHQLDFHSPYGCSKGAADQYIRDFGRIYDIPTIVFRMSCIYGPRQFGTEDQGWVAYFLIAALLGWPITIYGTGKQVRDILYVDDLVRAFIEVTEQAKVTAGNVYNIGGGPANSISIWYEFRDILQQVADREITANYGEWRLGDQLIYVSDTHKAEREFGWKPKIGKYEGIARLADWIKQNRELFSH